MIELPEAVVLARQIRQELVGKTVAEARANESPHRFAWYTGDPAEYGRRLAGKTIRGADATGNHVETAIGDVVLITSTSLRFHGRGSGLPANRQLLLRFSDQTALTAHVRMWGAIACVEPRQDSGMRDYVVSKMKPSVLSGAFDEGYFRGLMDADALKLSAKAFLATEQRIPGLGNGVLQDILWTSRIHPKRAMASLSAEEIRTLYQTVKSLLAEMVRRGGRDSENDLYGHPGGYRTVLSAKTASTPCPACGDKVRKESYLGGSIYYCPLCQPTP